MSVDISKYCFVCGSWDQEWRITPIISDELANNWQLTKLQREQFDRRESSFCQKCGNSLRSRNLAQTIINQIQLTKSLNLIDWISQANRRGLKIAEINSCGKLHSYLVKSSKLYYSEFNPIRNKLPFWKRFTTPQHEDIMSLSYTDNTFDLVIHSEVLEHVSNYHVALHECRRILKPSGICLFTVPIIPKRKTRECVRYDNVNKEIIHIKTPSYHGSGFKNDFLVWWEFGGDFIKKEKVEVAFKDNKSLSFVFKITKRNHQ